VPVRGRAGLRRILPEIAAIEPAGAIAFGPALERVAKRLRAPGLVVVVSDFLGDGAGAALERLGAQRHQVHAIEVLSPQDADPSREREVAGDLRLVDAETGAEVAISVSPRLRQLYREALAAHGARLDAAAKRLDAPIVRVRSDEPLRTAVLGRLQAAGLLG
jgi:uncharacterized protein (DUF58 family)